MRKDGLTFFITAESKYCGHKGFENSRWSNVRSSIIHDSQKVEATKCPWMAEGVKETWSVPTVECCSHALTWMKVKTSCSVK